jgi:hypothetical protein
VKRFLQLRSGGAARQPARPEATAAAPTFASPCARRSAGRGEVVATPRARSAAADRPAVAASGPTSRQLGLPPLALEAVT